MEETVDSGMSAEAVERAEWAWANLPVGPRKWTSLTTAEKALVCHITDRLTSSQSNAAEIAQARAEAFEEAARVADGLHATGYVQPTDWDYGAQDACVRIATAIRNLSKGPTDEG